MGAVAHVAMSKTTKALRDAAAKVEESDAGKQNVQVAVAPGTDEASDAQEPAADQAQDQEPEPARKERSRGGVGRAVVGALMLLIFANLCMLTIAFPTSFWRIYEMGWPMQIFLVGWGLCIIMYVSSSIWMLIPTGITFVTGGILAYCQLTGNWEHWEFLWLVEVWGAIISVFAPIFVAGNRRFARGLSRVLAVLLSLAAMATIVFISMGLGIVALP
jgi:hypothetical protein